MTTIGVRELRQHASRWLARVKAGERITVTERGKPIAELVPITEPVKGHVLERLIEQGLATEAEGSIREVLDRHAGPLPGSPLSPVLQGLRDDERY